MGYADAPSKVRRHLVRQIESRNTRAVKSSLEAHVPCTTTTMARIRRTSSALEGGIPAGTIQAISSTVEVPPHSTYAATQGEAQLGATEPQPQGTISSAT
ncbi:hypothetical protein AgCh_026225 [Apium graveolens]